MALMRQTIKEEKQSWKYCDLKKFFSSSNRSFGICIDPILGLRPSSPVYELARWHTDCCTWGDYNQDTHTDHHRSYQPAAMLRSKFYNSSSHLVVAWETERRGGSVGTQDCGTLSQDGLTWTNISTGHNIPSNLGTGLHYEGMTVVWWSVDGEMILN